MEHVRPPSPPGPALLEPDPVIEFYKRGIDLTLVDQSLRMTVQERMDAMVALLEFAEEVERAGRKAGLRP